MKGAALGNGVERELPEKGSTDHVLERSCRLSYQRIGFMG